MKRGRAIAACVLAATIATGAIIYALRPQEPEYQGRRLNEWLEHLGNRTWGGGTNEGEAEEAIRKIGTNALPALVRNLSLPASESFPRRKIKRVLSSQSFVRFKFAQPAAIRWSSAQAIRALGAEATPAVDQLAALLKQNRKDGHPFLVAVAMGRIGPEAVPIMASSQSGGLQSHSDRAL